jgi:hypothetical protein
LQASEEYARATRALQFDQYQGKRVVPTRQTGAALLGAAANVMAL